MGLRGREAHDGDDHGCVPGLGDRGRGIGLRAGGACGSRPRRSSGFASGWTSSIAQAADLIYRSSGSVIVTGMGKAGLVGQKLAATLASTGTRAFPLHPAEAVHGDLGRIRADDVVIALSQSGETEEVLRLIPALRRLGAILIAITERASSSLGQSGRPLRRAGADRGGVPAGTGPLGQHDRADGRRRRPGTSGQPDARLLAPRTSRSTIRPAAWAAS